MKVLCVHCSKCGNYVFSRTRHDFRFCPCQNVAIDGGRDYTKLVGDITSKLTEIEIPQTPNQLFDDWDKREDKFGILKSIEGLEINS